jgi:hypothetical protein
MRSSLSFGVAVLACAALAGSGCGHAPDDEMTSTVSQEICGRRRVVHPQAVYFADVDANGTGCPPGTWDIAISEDGETFTLRFNAYEATISEGQRQAVKDCQIDVDLGSPEGLSYAIASFHYQGYVLLEKPGMTARQTASYAFRGKRQNAADRNQIVGPADESYLYSDDVPPNRLVWSSCRRDEVLHVRTRLDVRNDPRRTGSGFINVASVDGALSFEWKLLWRRCPRR